MERKREITKIPVVMYDSDSQCSAIFADIESALDDAAEEEVCILLGQRKCKGCTLVSLRL